MTNFFITLPVFASSSALDGQDSSGIVSFLPFVLIFIVFYFLIIRPQSKKAKKHKEMLSSIKKGDRVLLSSGFYATVTKIFSEKRYIQVELSDKLSVQVLKDHVVEINPDAESKPETKKGESKKLEEENKTEKNSKENSETEKEK